MMMSLCAPKKFALKRQSHEETLGRGGATIARAITTGGIFIHVCTTVSLDPIL
jgi:hypothetical protein